MSISRNTCSVGLLAALFSVLCFTNPAGAQVTYQWDPGQTGIGSDGAGNWDFMSGIWAVSGSDQAWQDNNNAVFGANNGAAGTVTVAGQVTPNSITFNPAGSGDYLLTGGSINLPNTPTTITVNSKIS